MNPEQVRIVLVGTSHPGNIGAAARAMKTMGLARLYLVAPKEFPCAAATERAAGADDVLYAATVCATLPDALAGCTWVAGTSARRRHLAWPELDPRAAADAVAARRDRGDAALVFGRERTGLTNDELDLCRRMVHIPTDPGFSSLNLAAAVQILAYEIRRATAGEPAPPPAADAPAVTSEELEGFYRHLETTLVHVGYHDPEKPKHLMRRLRRLFGRTGIERSELNILRGILTAVGRLPGKVRSR